MQKKAQRNIFAKSKGFYFIILLIKGTITITLDKESGMGKKLVFMYTKFFS